MDSKVFSSDDQNQRIPKGVHVIRPLRRLSALINKNAVEVTNLLILELLVGDSAPLSRCLKY